MNDNQEQRMNNAREKDPLRLLALSDGVFATVLTLLVLDFKEIVLRPPDGFIQRGNVIICGFFYRLSYHFSA